MEKKMLDTIAEVLKISREMLQDCLDQKEIWDSLIRVEVIFAVEDEFDIRFDKEELASIETPRKLCEAALRKAES